MGKHCNWHLFYFRPYTIVCYVAWLLRWYWKFTIRGEEYGDDEKAYIIRRKLGFSCMQWDALEAPEKKEFFSRQLWIDANFQVRFKRVVCFIPCSAR